MLISLAMSSGLFAQQPAVPAGRFFGPMLSGWPAQSRPPVARLAPFALRAPASIALPKPAVKICSVPLLEMPISPNVDPGMPQVRPPMDRVAPMPQANVPASACDSPR